MERVEKKEVYVTIVWSKGPCMNISTHKIQANEDGKSTLAELKCGEESGATTYVKLNLNWI